MIAETAIIHPNVEIGDGATVEDYCVIGVPFRGLTTEKTVIGPGAIIRSHTVIYAGNRIGENFQTGNKANIRELNIIGDNVSIGTLSVVEHHVTIGAGVRLHTQVFVPEYCVLHEGCWLGPNVVLTNARYPQSPDAKESLEGVTVQRHARLGANSTVLPGLTVGEYALVGAGSVVTHDVDHRTIVAGNPARPMGECHY